MTRKDWQWIAALALVVSACGAANNSDDQDAAPSASGDAGLLPPDSTSELAGGWTWSATRANENAPFVTCNVSVGGGVFDITCPQGVVPRDVHVGCKQLRDDLHIHGSIGGGDLGRLEGMLDNLVEYEGDQCVGYGYTTGAPYPLPAFAQMSATQSEAVDLGGFLRHLGGRWDWTLDDTRSSGSSCEVHVGLDLGSTPGVKAAIACADDAGTQVLPGCTQQAFVTITAHVLPGRLDGVVALETRHTGTCGTLPSSTSVTTATMTARAQ